MDGRLRLTNSAGRTGGVFKPRSQLRDLGHRFFRDLSFDGVIGLSVVMEGVIADVAGSGCGHSCFDGGVGVFTGFQAFEEILHVVQGAVVEAFLGHDGILFAFAFLVDAESAAV